MQTPKQIPFSITPSSDPIWSFTDGGLKFTNVQFYWNFLLLTPFLTNHVGKSPSYLTKN